MCIYCLDGCPNSSRNRRSLIQTLPQTRSRRIGERNHEHARGSEPWRDAYRSRFTRPQSGLPAAQRTSRRRRPRGEWHLAVLRKPHSLRCQCVEVGFLDSRPVATEIGKAKIISHDQVNIRSFGGINRCKTSQCRNENTYPASHKFWLETARKNHEIHNLSQALDQDSEVCWNRVVGCREQTSVLNLHQAIVLQTVLLRFCSPGFSLSVLQKRTLQNRQWKSMSADMSVPPCRLRKPIASTAVSRRTGAFHHR